MTDFLYLVLHLACKVTCYFQLFSSVLVSVLRTSINVLSKSKSKNYVTWIANLTKLFLSVHCCRFYQAFLRPKTNNQPTKKFLSFAVSEDQVKQFNNCRLTLKLNLCKILFLLCRAQISFENFHTK